MLADITGYLAYLVEGVIGAPIAPDEPFMEAGLDSLGAVELRNSLATRYSLDLPASLVFDYPSIAALSSYLAAAVQPQAQLTAAGTSGQNLVSQHVPQSAAEVVGIACRYPGSSQGMCPAMQNVCCFAQSTSRTAKYFQNRGCRVCFMSCERIHRLRTTFFVVTIIQPCTCAVEVCKWNVCALSSLPTHVCYAGLTGFWKSAVSAADLPGQVPLERWDIDRAFSPQLPPSKMTMYTRLAAFCDGMPCFDAAAFRMTRPEATAIDPQQRLLMEECAAATDDAAANQASVGTFTGDGFSKENCK